MGCAPVMIFGKATRASLCTANNAASGGRRAGSGTACVASVSDGSVAGWARCFANQLAWHGGRDGACRLREFNRPRRWQRYFREFCGRSRRNRHTIVHGARRLAGAEDRQQFVHQAGEDRLFRAWLGGKRTLPGGGRCDQDPWLVGLGLVAIPDPKLHQLASSRAALVQSDLALRRPVDRGLTLVIRDGAPNVLHDDDGRRHRWRLKITQYPLLMFAGTQCMLSALCTLQT
jgi:hypothetical protein